MKIVTRQWLATGAALGAIGVVTGVIAWAQAEVEAAGRQRQQAGEIARGLTELRLVTFEYSISRLERAHAQWLAASERLDRVIAQTAPTGTAEKEILDDLRAKRAQARDLFAELSSSPAAGGAGAPSAEANDRFQAQALGRLLIGQQDSFSNVFRLTELAAARIGAAQQRMLAVILAGLAVLAAIIGAGAWFVRRDVLAPIVRLQEATGALAAGDWNARLPAGGSDEIGELARNFNAMADSLRASFAQAERSNQELAASNRELEAFSYSVSHDLRAPLRAMDGFSLALLEDYGGKLDAEGKDALERVRAASQRMGRLIDELLSLSRVTRAELNPKDLHLSAMAREIADSLQQTDPARAVRWQIAEGIRLRGDGALIEIALRNLLDNAWKFTGRTPQPEIRVGTRAGAAGTEYFVSDNGAGFDMAYANRLFGAFQRLHHADEFPGTGIGLAIVQRIVRRHGGAIRAEAAPGEGATFLFTVGNTKDASHG